MASFPLSDVAIVVLIASCFRMATTIRDTKRIEQGKHEVTIEGVQLEREGKLHSCTYACDHEKDTKDATDRQRQRQTKACMDSTPHPTPTCVSTA
ncbi:hypothetical protein C8Q74DRAFT_46066 [Fomes fomentarius]|nr:hypothetical protein C8Q74DRAFT_46066 [Fomes fomentarius]